MTELAKRRDDALATVQASPEAINAMLTRAIEHGTPVESLEKLVALHERVTAQHAENQFNEAMAAFKSECPPVPKRTENAQFKVTRDGRTRASRYAALEDIERTIRGPLGKHGLSFRWEGSKVENGHLTMTCIVSHIGGHSESSEVSFPVESRAGSSEQQKYGSVMTYAQRYSLIQALGLTTCDEDVDGNAPVNAGPTIDENQAANLDALMDEVKANRPAFLKFFGVESLSALPASEFKRAIEMLEAKRK